MDLLKIFLIIFIAVFSLNGEALVIGLGSGGLTPHFGKSKKNYCNQWNDSGIIYNRSRYIMIAKGNWAFTAFEGEDSICSPIDGFFFSYGFHFRERMDFSVIFGRYLYNQQNWKDHAARTPDDVRAPSPFTASIDGHRFIPVVGLQVGIHLVRSNTGWSLVLNNVLTPVITNHSLMLQMRF
jgi:hypothetical protein